MPTKEHCSLKSTHRLNIRATPRGTYCPLHTKTLIDVLRTLGTPFRIQRLKTKFPATCLFKTNMSWHLSPVENRNGASENIWRLLKVRTRKNYTPTK